jgi:hypothetical protein
VSDLKLMVERAQLALANQTPDCRAVSAVLKKKTVRLHFMSAGDAEVHGWWSAVCLSAG